MAQTLPQNTQEGRAGNQRTMPVYYTKEVIGENHWRWIKEWWNEGVSVVAMVRRLQQKRISANMIPLISTDIYATLKVMAEKGEINPNLKRETKDLTLEQFVDLFRCWKEGRTQADIISQVHKHKDNPVSETQIRNILRSIYQRHRQYAPTRRQQQKVDQLAADVLAEGERSGVHIMIDLQRIPREVLNQLRMADPRFRSLLHMEPNYTPKKYRMEEETTEPEMNHHVFMQHPQQENDHDFARTTAATTVPETVQNSDTPKPNGSSGHAAGPAASLPASTIATAAKSTAAGPDATAAARPDLRGQQHSERQQLDAQRHSGRHDLAESEDGDHDPVARDGSNHRHGVHPDVDVHPVHQPVPVNETSAIFDDDLEDEEEDFEDDEFEDDDEWDIDWEDEEEEDDDKNDDDIVNFA